jgi:hypothetical protein
MKKLLLLASAITIVSTATAADADLFSKKKSGTGTYAVQNPAPPKSGFHPHKNNNSKAVSYPKQNEKGKSGLFRK